MAEHDHIVLQLEFFGRIRLLLTDVGLTWPPPEMLVFEEGTVREPGPDDPREDLLERHRMSQLTDEQMTKLPGIARGAEYRYLVGPEGDDKADH